MGQALIALEKLGYEVVEAKSLEEMVREAFIDGVLQCGTSEDLALLLWVQRQQMRRERDEVGY